MSAGGLQQSMSVSSLPYQEKGGEQNRPIATVTFACEEAVHHTSVHGHANRVLIRVTFDINTTPFLPAERAEGRQIQQYAVRQSSHSSTQDSTRGRIMQTERGL